MVWMRHSFQNGNNGCKAWGTCIQYTSFHYFLNCIEFAFTFENDLSNWKRVIIFLGSNITKISDIHFQTLYINPKSENVARKTTTEDTILSALSKSMLYVWLLPILKFCGAAATQNPFAWEISKAPPSHQSSSHPSISIQMCVSVRVTAHRQLIAVAVSEDFDAPASWLSVNINSNRLHYAPLNVIKFYFRHIVNWVLRRPELM